MTINALALTNPGAETGSVTGWTSTSGIAPTVVTSPIHSGSYAFAGNVNANVNNANSRWGQQIDISAYSTAIDGNLAAVAFSGWHIKGPNSSDTGQLFVQAYASDGTTLLGSNQTTFSTPSTWTQDSLLYALPSGTRYVTFGTYNQGAHAGIYITAYWDDFSASVSDNRFSDYPGVFDLQVSQVVAYGLVSQPAAQLRTEQAPILVVGAAETSNGNYLVKSHQVVVYALVKGKVDRVDLRAWTFLQDDHLFYGLQLGNLGTIVHDVSTQQWCQWYSPGFNYWRAEDVTDWEGYNLACDTENGTIWKIDPTGRLDDGDTVITSTVTGQATVRGRRVIPCYMAEIACSQASPAGSGTSIRLRTSDDGGDNWVDHGTLSGAALGTATLFRYNGLGVMQAPGRIFEITNVGYARRIDGLDLELGARP